MKDLQDKFKADTKDFEKYMMMHIDRKINGFIMKIDNKVESSELLVNSGTIDAQNTVTLMRKNIQDLQT